MSKKLSQSARFLFREGRQTAHFDEVANLVKEYADDERMKEFHDSRLSEDSIQTDVKDPLDDFYEKLWVIKPYLINSNDKIERDLDELKVSTLDLLASHIKADSLNLHYDRNSYNTSLAKVLRHFHINISSGLSSEIIGSDDLSESEQVYTQALSTILDTFIRFMPEEMDDDISKIIFELHKKMACFLKEVKLCVIQTGEVDDAYTLFEVMNDRALALDDLDLIKNQFFKEFVQKNSAQLDDETLDSNMQLLDRQWGDEIFNASGIRENSKKLVSYFGTVYLTGDDSITNTKNEKYRGSLKKYLESNNTYGLINIQRDFNVFQVCYELIKQSSLPYNRRESKSLAVEHDLYSTDFKKTMYFLNALKQDGVISGLVNFVLKNISSFKENFDVDFSKKFISLLFEKEPNLKDKIKNSFPADKNTLKNIEKAVGTIQKQSRIIWLTSMMAPNADAPRNLSRDIIRQYKSNALGESLNQQIKIVKPNDTSKLVESFKNWLEKWDYEKDPNSTKFKIKTLFARLLKMHLEDDKIIQTTLQTTISVTSIEALELDHLVPQNSREDSILNLNEQERELYIHSIANMMPLPKVENIKKSNYSLENALVFYEQSGLSRHFLLEQIETLLAEVNNKNIKPIMFFEKRKANLINYFSQIVKW